MADKQLKDKTIDIHGKKYVMVKDRLIYFNDTYPDGSITTELVSEPTNDLIIIKATVKPGGNATQQTFTGYSQAIVGGTGVNATAALENCETSAVGRALAMMGIGVLDSVASADEINKSSSNTMKYATEKQIKWIRDTAFKLHGDLNGEEEIDEYIESVLTIRPDQVPIYKVKDAVDALKKATDEDRAEAIGSDIDLDQQGLPY